MECTICAHQFSKGRLPLNLPCGHVFCQKCIVTLKETKSLLCPICQASHAGFSVTDLKRNEEIEPLIEETKSEMNCESSKDETGFTKAEGNMCATHESLLCYWCKTCRLIICADCMIISHGTQRHKVLSSRESLVHLQSECKAKIKSDKEKLRNFKAEAQEAIVVGERMVKKLKETMTEMDEYIATLKNYEATIMSSPQFALAQMLSGMNRKEPVDLLDATEDIPRILRENLYLNRVFKNWAHVVEGFKEYKLRVLGILMLLCLVLLRSWHS